MTVLIVDDDPVSRRLIRMTLERRKHQVAEVASAEDAVEWLKAGASCTLVITDIGLPGRMDGIGLFEHLRASPQWRDLPAIVCSGLADEGTVRRAIEGGVRNYLLKPVRPQLLIETVDGLLARAVPVLEPRFDAMARLEVSEAEYRYLVEDCLARVTELSAQLTEALDRQDHAEAARIAGRLREPAALLGGERLVRAADAATSDEATPRQREQSFTALRQEVQVLSEALKGLSRPGQQQRTA
jgi:CheY-like chemotaxis protein